MPIELLCRCETPQHTPDTSRSVRHLWGFCDDDVFCPRCGKRITLVDTENLRDSNRADRAERELWIYPRKVPGYRSPQFAFPAEIAYADQSRQRRYRPLDLDVDQSRGPTAERFQPKLKMVMDEDSGRSYCVLLLKDGVAESPLPNGGLENEIVLAGEFGKVKFPVRICNEPKLQVDLSAQEGGIEKAKDKEWHWQITRADRLEVDLALRAVTAPILIEKTLDRIVVTHTDATAGIDSVALGLSVKLETPLEKGTEITPTSPWSSKVVIDARGLTEPGEQRRLLMSLKAAVYRLGPLVLQLERIQKGKLEFYPNPVNVDVMYAGEVRSTAVEDNPEPATNPVIKKLFIENVGEESVTLQPLTVDTPDLGLDASWISVRWATDVDDRTCRPDGEGKLNLEPSQRGEAYIRVDLAAFNESNLPPDNTLKATISTVDERGTPWTVEFRIIHLLPRTESPHPLAIDFGNSNSYTAIRHPGDPYVAGPGTAIVPAHDLLDPEHSPTALFFKEIGNEANGSKRVFVIGNEAVALAGESERLVTDLKRAIGKGSKQPVTDQHGETELFRNDLLIQLYLEELIRQSERVIRKHFITKIGVSYPAKFCPERRKAFRQIINNLCRDSASDPNRPRRLRVAELDLPGVNIHADPEYGIDEANAVAIGFAFNVTDQERYLYSLISPESPDFVVASFDLGGGSLDTALIRFHVREGDIYEPTFASTYLGIGGHEHFGGDHVSIAFMELLKERIGNVLRDANLPWEMYLGQIPSPVDRFQNRRSRSNFHVVFSAAEQIKLFSCAGYQGPQLAEEQKKLRGKLEVYLGTALDAPLPDETQSAQARQAISQAIDNDVLMVGLEEACNHKVQCDHDGNGGYTVRQRITEAVKELQEFAESSKIDQIDFVVLGGSGSRLPEVQRIVTQELQGTTVIFDPKRLKFRVAEGLVRHLDLLESPIHELARSRDYTSRTLGIRRLRSEQTWSVVPNCSPVNELSKWHEFKRPDERLANVARCLKKGTCLELYRTSHGFAIELHGSFDLAQPPTGCDRSSDDKLGLPSPKPLPEEVVETLCGVRDGKLSRSSHERLSKMHGAFRLVGSENHIELRIKIGDDYFGYWKMQTPGNSSCDVATT